MQKLTEPELQEIARQLRCPDGEDGLKTAELMNVSNANIIAKTIAALEIRNTDSVLEIGPGNGLHVKDIFSNHSPKSYQGIDISPTMLAKATQMYSGSDTVSFLLSDGETIPFGESLFNKVFTVNTIYFWKDPQEYANEIYRVLKSGGRLCIGFVPKRIMENIPFAKYGFNLWEEAAVTELLEKSGFKIIDEITEKEFITGNMGQQIEREFVVLLAEKK